MLIKTLKLSAGTLIVAIVGAVYACHSESAAQAPAGPARSPHVARQPDRFVGTVPVTPSDEAAVTPMETVAAPAK